MVEIKFVKMHKDAKLPENNHKGDLIGDSGYDLFCVKKTLVESRGSKVIPIGVKVGYITPGYWFKVEARSGLSFNYSLLPHPGIIDNTYRGNLGILIFNHSNDEFIFNKGDKVAQLVIYPLIQIKTDWINEANETERGEKGFGSSDKIKI